MPHVYRAFALPLLSEGNTKIAGTAFFRYSLTSGKRQSYERLGGGQVLAEEMSLCARCFCLSMPHRAFPVTTAIALGAAAFSPGTTAHALLGQPASGQTLRIGHMSGIFSVGIEMQGAQIKCASLIRTARRIMDGQIYLP